ncbi:MAG: penicillin acylase family protein [Alphaproteobacteria bacterium]
MAERRTPRQRLIGSTLLALMRMTWSGTALARQSLSSRNLRLARRSRSTAERLAMLPSKAETLREPIDIYWNGHQIPFVDARNERDLAVGMGLAHGHLRLTQIEIMRRIALGRTAEILGPAAVPLDQTVRIVGLARRVGDIEAALPEATREWMEGFADGINAVIAQAREWPEEFALLDIRPEPFSVRDLIAIGRLAAGDFSWKVWQRLLPLKERDDWHTIWERLMETPFPMPSYSGTDENGLAAAASELFSRHGSNAFAVSAERSSNGAAMIASDPHLGMMLPNLFLIAGMRAPGLHAVGLMIPGVPVMAVGRNEHIAWGGTSLHAASSDLFDVTDLGEKEITRRTEEINVRWLRPKTVDISETRFGPIISDAPLLPFPKGRRYALRWIGHDVNDEITAMLGVARARNWQEFHDALESFAAPAQNMIYADTKGRVGQAMAAHLPRRASTPPIDLIAERGAIEDWEDRVNSGDLPFQVDPPAGYVASANNRPGQMEVPVGFFFAPDERVDRISAMIENGGRLDLEKLKAIQNDVIMHSAPEFRDRMLAFLPENSGNGAVNRVRSLLAGWDGAYTTDSQGALVFEFLIYHFLASLHGPRRMHLYLATWDTWTLLADDLNLPETDRLEAAMVRAASKVERVLDRYRRWGDVHRLRLSHMFSMAPVIGRAYRFTNDAVAGSNETVMKTAHGLSGRKHNARLGAIARHLSDLAHPDRNWFVLLGGQDGWLGSANFLDQYRHWRRGDYIQVPLSVKGVKESFRYKTAIMPRHTGRAGQVTDD